MKHLAFGIALVASSAYADEQIWQQMVSRGRSVTSNFKEQVYPRLSAKERSIAEQIIYRIVATPAANAQARVDAHGQRRIEVGAGLMLTYELMSVAMTMQAYGNPQCGKDYIEELFAGIDESTYLSRLGQKARPGVEPFEYAARHPSNCQNVTVRNFQENSNAMRGQQALLGGSLRWLLAHELGHHLFNHVMSAPENTADSRRRESEADSFANRIAVVDGPDAIGWAMPAYLTMIRLGASGENENASTHPAGARRARILFDTLAALPDKVPAFRADLEARGLLQSWSEKMSMIRKAIEEDLK